MPKLTGEQLKITTPILRKNLNKRVQFILKNGKGEYTPAFGTITEIVRKQVDLGGSDFIPFNQIVEMVLAEPILKE